MEDNTNEIEKSKEKPKQTKTETQSKGGYLSKHRLMSKAVETMKILSRHTVHLLNHSEYINKIDTINKLQIWTK